jgi:hypothetical protein
MTMQSPVTVPLIDYDAERFLTLMAGKSFSYIGAAMLIRAHLLLTETYRMKPAQLYQVLRIRTLAARALVDEVLETTFRTDSEGYIYSGGVDRMMARYAPQVAEGG